MSTYTIEAGTAQHIGDRPVQHDRVALYRGARAPGYLLAVLADGFQGGAIAAEQVLQTSQQLFNEYPAGDSPNLERLAGLLRDIADECHTILRMGTFVADAEPLSTMVLLIITPDHQAIWALVGESRLYQFHRSKPVARSNDTAYVAHLVTKEAVPPEMARKHRHSSVLGNALGHPLRTPFVTIGSYSGLRPGDSFLLCSDGLWSYFTDEEMGNQVSRKPPREAAERLISKGIERAAGKGDNASMVIVKMAPLPSEEINYVVKTMGRAV